MSVRCKVYSIEHIFKISDRSKVIALGDQKYACFISCFTSFRLSGDGIIFVGKKGNG